MRLYQKKAIRFFLENVKQISVTLDKVTGKSFSEALILASTNQQYDKRLFIELPVQHLKTTSPEHGKNMLTEKCLINKQMLNKQADIH